MPLINASTRTLQLKIVYYGPGLSGKTTNLEQLSMQLDPARVGELMTLDTTGDRTLFFDWMPVELGKIKGFDVKIQLFTVPGQVRYNNTRKKVLQGVDGLVFVADSQAEALDQNRFSFQNLRENLAEQAIDLEDLPLVVQWNKRDLPTAMDTAELASRLNLEQYDQIQAVASDGRGVKDTLRLITQHTLTHVRRDLLSGGESSGDAPHGPMDGDAMLDFIMAGDGGPPAPSGDAGMSAVFVDDAEVTGSRRDGADAGEAGGSFEGRLTGLEQQVRALSQAVQQLAEQLAGRVPDIVEREVEPITEKVADLESRLGIMQRVVTRLGGRVDVLERRVARVEIVDRQPGRSEELKEMAGHVHDLSRLMAAFARRLGHPAPAGQSPDAAAIGSDDPEDSSDA